MRAIDLYSGIGGWTLGLELAGIEIVSSYEWWNKANKTHNINAKKNNQEVNIRTLKLEDLPKGIDIVVGSPPCTQFSFSNRGGKGDMEDGLIDIKKFLDVIQYIKPKYWAMENVPRVSQIIAEEILPNGRLAEYRNLFSVNEVIDMSEYGVPQKRKRMIAGNFPFQLLDTYKSRLKSISMGDVLNALYQDSPQDILYGVQIQKDDLTDNEHEDFLSDEELRINSDSKTMHPIYNKMSFPDPLEKPVRTITATCTRVSRESVIIEDVQKKGSYRRLSVRERGLLQGFPITYQYYGDSHSEKLKMIGNAIPPAFTYYLAHAMKETSIKEIPLLKEMGYRLSIPTELPKKTKPDSKGKTYPITRKFCAAIPSLRFGSGVRFDLSNSFDQDKNVNWKVSFFYGSSKKIIEMELSNELFKEIKELKCWKFIEQNVDNISLEIRQKMENVSSYELQNVWRHISQGITPHDVVDFLDKLSNELYLNMSGFDMESRVNIQNFVSHKTAKQNKKLEQNSLMVFVGCIIGIVFNNISLSTEKGTLCK